MPVNMIQTAVDNGLIFGLIALSLFVSFTILNICDLSTDGSYMLGAAVGVTVTIAGHPVLAIPAAMAASALSGFVVALLQTKFGVQSILAAIIVNTGLYTINLMIMGMKTNLNIVGKKTVFDLVAGLFPGAFWKSWHRTVFLLVLLTLVVSFLYFFMCTRIGLSVRATGDNPAMVRASSINPAVTITIGLCLGNAMTGMAGALIGQYNKNCEINMGTGMVTIALASLIIGQTLFGWGSMRTRIIGTVAGSVIYRFVIALALRINIPTQAFKLVSALIVAAAILVPAAREKAVSAMKIRKNRAQEG